jgi:hypothetical protein
MNCTAIQRRLLASERPDQPPAEVKSHLAGCPVCRGWQRHLLEIERLIAQLPIPPSTTRARLLQKIQPAPAAAEPPAILPLPRPGLAPPPNVRAKERAQWKLAWALASAAALALFAVGWWAWPHNQVGDVVKAPPDPYRDKEAGFNARLAAALAGAQSPREKMWKVVDFIDDLHRQARTEVGHTDQLALTVRYHGEFMRKDLLEYARALPADAERPGVLQKIALRLQDQESRAAELASRVKGDAAESLRQMADATREGHLNLLALARGQAG